MSHVRSPAVAGLFYPADPAELERTVRGYLVASGGEAAGPGLGERAPKGLIVPHAGYPYSGPVAGTAYARLEGAAGSVRRVVLLGPAHRVPLWGLALPGSTVFATPLGPVAVDPEAEQMLEDLPQVTVDDRPHRPEHSLEVQLPFLQIALGQDFRLIPLVVGEADADEVCQVLERLWGGAETLIVVSTDLSHYHDYETAQRLDARTSQAIEARDVEQLRPDGACGFMALRGLLLAARHRDLTIRNLDLRNSGDTAGPRDQVVGYGAYIVS